MNQHTLSSTIRFCGKGLHSGRKVEMILSPAPEGHGVVFRRTDLRGEPEVPVCADNIYRIRRSTSLRKGRAEVRTTEHLLAALMACGVDNVLVSLDSAELPALDGSASRYVTAIEAAGLLEQSAVRKYVTIEGRFEKTDPKSGSSIVVEPAEEPEFEVTVDYGSTVVGIQSANWNKNVNFADEIAPCRTFCFLSEIKPLLALGLIKGGSLGNALVIDEPEGYYGGAVPLFENECARHKLLDLIGDFALLGGPLKARVVAYKPGHKINTETVKALTGIIWK